MSEISVLGAGAFGTALAIAFGQGGRSVTLWARDDAAAEAMSASRRNAGRLPDAMIPETVTVTGDLAEALKPGIILLAMPMQSMRAFLAEHGAQMGGKALVACSKGVDLSTGLGPSGVIAAGAPGAIPAILSGPSFAADIARGLPTALTIAAGTEAEATRLQHALSTQTLRLYSSADMTGVELGGALKNVMAIACGIAIGAGLGESARAALLTRGYAEMQRFAAAYGADPDTLSGLSGLGDLALTCTSEKSRNYSYGIALARGEADPTKATVEGIATARAVAGIAREKSIEMPVASVVSELLAETITIEGAIDRLMSRPLKKE